MKQILNVRSDIGVRPIGFWPVRILVADGRWRERFLLVSDEAPDTSRNS
jgi:hypothetical protein